MTEDRFTVTDGEVVAVARDPDNHRLEAVVSFDECKVPEDAPVEDWLADAEARFDAVRDTGGEVVVE